MDEVISSKDPEVIKGKRSSLRRMISTICNNMAKKLGGGFDHAKIPRGRILSDLESLKKHKESFEVIHEAYLQFRKESKDETEEETLALKQEDYYNEVMDKICESLDLCASYEKSYKSFEAAQPDPDLEKKLSEEKKVKAVLAKQLEEEEAIQKQEAETAAKAEKDKVMKELRSQVLKSELDFKESVGLYRTAKKYAEDMTRFTKELSKEDVVSQVLQFAHVRALPTYETKNMLVDRLKAASEAAVKFRDAIEAESGIEDAKSHVTFDRVEEDKSVQDLVSVLDLLLNAKVEFNGKGSVSSQPTSTRSTPIKVKLNTPKFSGRSRDFAIYKKEFMDVIVPGRSDPEIGALLRDGRLHGGA